MNINLEGVHNLHTSLAILQVILLARCRTNSSQVRKRYLEYLSLNHDID